MDKALLFTSLVIFPFGQITKLGPISFLDVIVFLIAIYTLLRKPKIPSWYIYFLSFILFGFFSWGVNAFILKSDFLVRGLMYGVRLLVYSIIPIFIYNFFKAQKDRKFIINSLLSVSIITAVFGWIQYINWPNLVALKYLGWDDHLYRLVGTFLDPTFTSIILVLGSIIALKENRKLSLIFLGISILFTYSRISYLVFILLLVYFRKYLIVFLFVVSIFFLPKNMGGEGVNLVRTSSTNLKIINYKETLKIITKSPVIGVGFNNLCPARQIYLNDTNITSHSCFGSDSSILFILATTGIIGLFLFISFIFSIPSYPLLTISFLAVLIHSTFANSLFYPWVMFWIFILLGLGSKINSK
jgi:hypothetical protein